jgi:hypothetical protein
MIVLSALRNRSSKLTKDYGMLYCAVKTSYDEAGYTKVALLVRCPNGIWDDLYPVSDNGTAPIVLLNEALGKVKVVYSADTYGGTIFYKDADTSNISFSPEQTLINGINNYATSTHYTYNSDVVVLVSDETRMVGILTSDDAGAGQGPVSFAVAALARTVNEVQEGLLAYPNPIQTKATIRFTLKTDGPYTLTRYDNNMGQVVYQKQGMAKAGEQQDV